MDTLAQFKGKTDKNNGGSRGSNIKLVDDALEAYDAELLRGNATHAELIAALWDVANSCQDWLKKKRDKSDFTKSLLGHTNIYNQLFTRRKKAISELCCDAMTELAQLLDANNLLPQQLRAKLAYDVNKFKDLGSRKSLSRQAQSKPLASGYTMERTSWEKSGKTSVISGSGVHGAQKIIAQDATLNLTRSQRKANAKVSTNKAKLSDWSALEPIARQNFIACNMLYARKAERMRYLVMCDHGHMVDWNGAAITTPRACIYAMGKYGNLFLVDDVAEINRLADQGVDRINHSTPLAGGNVMCAGMMEINNGVLRDIDNGSGHYAPGRSHLYDCIQVLAVEGFDLSQTRVHHKRFPGPAPGQCYVDSYTLAEFCTDAGKGGTPFATNVAQA